MKFKADFEKFYSAEFRAEFLAYLYEGETISETCGILRVNPAAYAVYSKENPDFASDVKNARAFRVDILADKLENIHLEIKDALLASVASKNIQWLASKRYREIYGDKVDHNHNVQINIVAAMEEAKQRTLGFDSANVLDNIHSATDNISVAQDKLPIIDVDIDDDDDPFAD